MQDGAGRVKQKGRLVNDCEMVSSEDQLQTAREVYESLSAKGYVLKYQCALRIRCSVQCCGCAVQHVQRVRAACAARLFEHALIVLEGAQTDGCRALVSKERVALHD